MDCVRERGRPRRHAGHGLDRPRISSCARTAWRARFCASSPATDSLRVAVLIDNSQEMRNDLIDLRQSLRGFVNEIDRRHEVSLIGIRRTLPPCSSTTRRDLKRLETGISRLFARPGTGSYLLSAIIDTSRALRKRRDLRRVMVIITTQGPEFSEISYQTVLEYVRESGAPMHSYVLRREGVSPTDAGRPGSRADAGRRHADDRRPPRRTALGDGDDAEAAVARRRAESPVSDRVRAAEDADSAQDDRSRRAESPTSSSARRACSEVAGSADRSGAECFETASRRGPRALFVGINPGIRSAETGHHFAGYSNRFWKLLFESKLVPNPIDWRGDDRLPEWGFGITNLVARETPGIDTLSREECTAGIGVLRAKVRRFKPEIVAFVGVSLYRWIFGDQGRRQARPSARDVRRRRGIRAPESERPECQFLIRANAGRISKAPT